MNPNSLIPQSLFGLGVEVDHADGSQTFLIELTKCVFFICYAGFQTLQTIPDGQ